MKANGRRYAWHPMAWLSPAPNCRPAPLYAGTPLAIPLSSWLLCESLIRWAGAWQPGEIVTAADALQRAIVDAADGGGLRGQVGVAFGHRMAWLLGLHQSALPGRVPAVAALVGGCIRQPAMVVDTKSHILSTNLPWFPLPGLLAGLFTGCGRAAQVPHRGSPRVQPPAAPE